MDLSKLRAMIVREESLAGFARDCQFDQFIKLGKGEEKSGGRNRDTILGDAFEAFLGALLLDKDLLTVKEFIYQVMIPKVEAGDFEMIKDYKTHLQELLQVNGDVDIRYQVISENGPAHDKMFEVEVLVEGQSLGRGQGRSKKLAEQEAAKNAGWGRTGFMYLKEIEIQGFKSFADKTKVVFDQGVTAVVGPKWFWKI